MSRSRRLCLFAVAVDSCPISSLLWHPVGFTRAKIKSVTSLTGARLSLPCRGLSLPGTHFLILPLNYACVHQRLPHFMSNWFWMPWLTRTRLTLPPIAYSTMRQLHPSFALCLPPLRLAEAMARDGLRVQSLVPSWTSWLTTWKAKSKRCQPKQGI
jgi:hypothetical protein